VEDWQFGSRRPPTRPQFCEEVDDVDPEPWPPFPPEELEGVGVGLGD